MENILNIKCDSAAISRIIDDASGSVAGKDDSFKKIVKRLFNVLNLSHEIRTIKVDGSPAGANELLIRLEPSDRLRGILSAIIAGDVKFLVIEHDKLLQLN